MSQKHRRHKYRPLRQSNPVSSHFLSLYSNYNTLVCLKLGVDFLLKNWEFRVFAKQPLSKKLGILRFRQTGHVQKIGTFIIRTGLIRNIFHPKTRSEAHFFVSLHFD